MDKEKLAKIRERFPYVDLCMDKKNHSISVSIEVLYELIFTKNII